MVFLEAEIAEFLRISIVSPNRDKVKHKSYLLNGKNKKEADTGILDRVGVVFTFDGGLNLVFCDGHFSYRRRVCFLEEVNNNFVNTKYVYYYLLANIKRLEKLYRVSDLRCFTLLLSHFRIKYPPIADQYEIVRRIDAVFNLIALTQRSLQIMEMLPYALYQEFSQNFGMIWNSVKLNEIVENFYYDRDNGHKMPGRLKKSERVVVLGETKKLHLIAVSSKVNLEFLECLLSSMPLYRGLEDTKHWKFSLYKLMHSELKLPSREEQKRIINYFRKCDEIKGHFKEWLCVLHELAQYYLHCYLYRKSFGKNLDDTFHEDILKYSYSSSMMVDSLMSYDTLRKELFGAIENGDFEQYYDTFSNSVKLRKR